MRRLITATMLAATLTAGTITTANAIRIHTDAPVTDTSTGLTTKGGPIRIGPKMYAHANNAHAVMGYTNINLYRHCDLVISLNHQPGERVVSAVVEEDETLTRLGIQGGGSGGVESLTIYLYDRRGRKVCANDRRFGRTANLWVHITTVVAPA